jgi:ribosome-associated protein
MTDDLKKYLIPAFERKAKSILAIDVKKLTSYADVIVIIEAGSQRQVTSIAEHLIKRLKERKIKALGAEGVKEGEWALLDYGAVIIHVFESKIKSLYDLEGLWADAPRIDLSQFEKTTETEEEDDED